MTELRDIDIITIFPNPDQPRKHFDPIKLEELAMSIRQYGVQQPIKVAPRGKRYMIVMGERRYRASLLAGKVTIPAVVEDLTDENIAELALLENIQRQDMNIIEEAKAFQSLLDRGWSKEEIAQKIGFKQVWRVDERISLLKLAPEYQDMVIKGALGNSEAFEMSRVSSSKQAIVLKKVISGELGTYNKLRSFVDGLVAIEKQENFFEFELLSEEEREQINKFDALLSTVERLIREVGSTGEMSFRKAGFRADIKADRLDLIIKSLMKIRKTLISGEGMKHALQAA